MTPRLLLPFAWVIAAVAGPAAPVLAQDSLSASQRARIDSAVTQVLASTGAPSASIAVVLDGRIVYERAYGSARLEPDVAATPAMRYSIGSVSKQFTAAAILLLAEAGKLSLDDKVAKWLPELTRAREVTIRQLLSMTAGYQDYWPQDYVFPAMQQPAAAGRILDEWARKPLDFDPGTRWQYSNTNYVIAGLIVERAGGMPFMRFLQQRIFTPLGMTSATSVDSAPLGAGDAGGYLRNALGPLRQAPKEGRGWLFAAGGLGMTAHDLARWDVAVIDGKVLRAASHRAMQTDTRLSNGTGTGYGLGVGISAPMGRRRISHGGAVSGYLTANEIYPDNRAAIVVFANAYPGAAGPTGSIAGRIRGIIFEKADSAAAAALARMRGIFGELQQGRVDRAQLSSNASAYFTEAVLADYSGSLGPLGTPTSFEPTGEFTRGGMTGRGYVIKAGPRTLSLSTFTLPDGRIEQYLVERAD